MKRVAILIGDGNVLLAHSRHRSARCQNESQSSSGTEIFSKAVSLGVSNDKQIARLQFKSEEGSGKMKPIEVGLPIFIIVGEPETHQELEEMFRLRARELRRRGFIQLPTDVDCYDLEKGKCIYFIAKCNQKIVGTARLIIDVPLPTQIYFRFEEPEEMREIPPGKRAEISRLIASAGKINPIVILALIKAFVQYGYVNNLLGGYAFIKKGLARIIRNMGIPFHPILPFEIVPEGERVKQGYILPSYFDPNQVLPIYYLRDEVAEFLLRNENEILNRFRKEDHTTSEFEMG